MRLRLTVEVEAGDVTPEMLAAGLRAHGWQQVDPAAGWESRMAERGGAVWTLGNFRVVVPTRGLADWPTRLQETVQMLASVEGRSPLAVLADIRASWVRALLAERGVTEVVEIAAHLDGSVVVAVYFGDDGARWPIADCEWLAENRDGLSPTEAVGPWVDWTAWADAVAEAWRTVAG